MLEEKGEGSERRQAIADLRRLANIILDNLEDGSRRKLLDPKEIRLLGSTAMRSIRLYLAALEHGEGKNLDKTPVQSAEKVARKHQEAETANAEH